MSKKFLKIGLGVLVMAGLLLPALAAQSGARTKKLSGHVPAVVSKLTSLGDLPATNKLHLALGLPLRNQDVLDLLLQQIADPSSPNYRHFLTPKQFDDQFAPTAGDVQAVLEFARTNGFTVTRIHSNRMLVEVSCDVSNVERAFNVKLHKYHHPNENRDFFAPDQEPSVPVALPMVDVDGMSSYARPYPKHRVKSKQELLASPKLGSGPFGSYMGNDFRAAYVPGTTLTGAGQKVALVQFDGYYASDIALYAQQAGLPTPALTNILLNGFSGVPTGNGGEVEVSLDIEMVISMAPGISQVLVYEGDPFNFIPNVVLNQIAVDNSARQVSCSWGWTGGPNATSDQIFKQMALQGQSFYNASGDSDAFLPGQVDSPTDFGYPSCSPYITQVGGTTLNTTGPGGAWISEQVWNWGGGIGSCGGVSDFYSIPTWQQGINMTTNHGSLTGRNIPDVALTADNVYVIADNGIQYPGTGGTSCAAPLWAGLTALINQQAALNGRSSVGFINPAIYALAKTPSYTNLLNDIVVGDNTWSLSPTNYFAVPGYDLCTGLGTPRGTNLINALANGSSGSAPIISAPLPPWGTQLSALNGGNPNGSWFLFIQDDKQLDVGMITNGWSVTLTTANPIGNQADNQIYITPEVATVGTNSNWTLNLAVTNYGPSSYSTNVFVSDTLPGGGVSLTSYVPSAGAVSVIGDTLTWTIGNLAVNTGAALSLTFRANSAGSYTNEARVYAATSDPNPDDDGASASLTVSSVVTHPVLTPVLGTGTGTSSFQLTVTGANGQPAVVQASTNLVTWVPVYTNLIPFTYTNLDSTNFPMRFYRVLQ